MMNALFHISKTGIAIDWDQIGQHVLTIVWQLVITTVVFLIISKLGERLIRRYATNHNRKLTKRSKTLAALTNSIFHYLAIFFYFFAILSIVGVPIGTLLASAGIFSLALGMGAQGFVTDIVNGFFILSEAQYDVGDLIQIGTSVGTVLQLGLRTTKLKASDGSIIFIPNRNITIVKNLAHGGIGLSLDFELAADNDLADVTRVFGEANQTFKIAAKRLVSGPTVIGVMAQNGLKITYRLHFQVVPGSESLVRNAAYRHYLACLHQANITLAQTSTTTVEPSSLF